VKFEKLLVMLTSKSQDTKPKKGNEREPSLIFGWDPDDKRQREGDGQGKLRGSPDEDSDEER
jgi:hypothetical protein